MEAVIHLPGEGERREMGSHIVFMRDLSEAGKAGLSQGEVAKIASKYDFKPV